MVCILFLNSSMKKNQINSANFSIWHRKMTLKVRIVPYLTLNSKTTEKPKIFFDRFHSPLVLLSKAACKKISLITLLYVKETNSQMKSLFVIWHISKIWTMSLPVNFFCSHDANLFGDMTKSISENFNLFTTSESPNIRIPILQIFVFIYWRGNSNIWTLWCREQVRRI